MTDGPRELKDLRSATVRGLRWVMVARPSVELMLVGSMVVLARLIPPAQFGHFATASLVSGFGAASVTAITTALVQRPTLEREHLQAAHALALAAGLVLAGLTLLAADFIIDPTFGPGTASAVRLSAPGTFVAAAGAVPFAVLQRRLEFRRLSVNDIVGSAFRSFGSVALALIGLDAGALVLGMVAATAAQTAMAWRWAPPPLPRPRWRPTRELLHNGAPNWLAAVSWIGFANCDYAIVGARLGAVQSGLYFRAYTLAVEYQKKVSNVASTLGLPVLARTRNSEDLGELRAQMVSLLTVLLFPCLVLLAVLAPVAVPVVFGPEWAPAVVPTQILAVGGAATLVIDAVGTTLMASGRSRAVLGFGWGHFVTYAVAVWFVAPLGLTGVAAAAAGVHAAYVVVAYALMLRSGRVGVLARIWEDIAPATCSCVAIAATAVPLNLAMSAADVPTFLHLAAVTLVAAVSYLAVLRTFFPAAWQTVVSLVRRLLPNRIAHRRPAPVLAAAALED